MFGHKRDRHHQNRGPIPARTLHFLIRAGTDPFLRGRPGLVTDSVIHCRTPDIDHRGDRPFNLPLIRIAALDDHFRQAMRREQHAQRHIRRQLRAGAVVARTHQGSG